MRRVGLAAVGVILLGAACVPPEVTTTPDEPAGDVEEDPEPAPEPEDPEPDALEPDPEPDEAGEPDDPEPEAAGVGDAITLEGRNTDLRVTVLEVIDPSEPSRFAPDEGNRLVAVDLELVNVGDGVYDRFPSNQATLIDVDHRQYSGTIETTPSCLKFDGTVTLAPDDVRRGCVFHELPEGVGLRTFQFDTGRAVGVWELAEAE